MPQQNSYQWIDTEPKFAELCQSFSAKKWLTLDTEFIRETTYYAIPGLLQFSDGNNNWLVDPLNIDDWSPLKALLDSDLLWVMHACNEDLELLHLLTGSTPKKLFDTQIAAQFAGLGHSLGYQKLIVELCQVELEKGESRTNWLQRPLTQKQLDYATDDVHYLALGWQKLLQQLQQLGCYEFFLEDMQIISQWQPVDLEQIYTKVKFAWQLQQQKQVNRLQALAKWREQRAQLKDKPKRRILEDEKLLDICEQNPQSVADFCAMGILNTRQAGIIAAPILEVLAAAENSEACYPSIRRTVEIPGSKQIIKKWKIRALEIAQENNLPATILFTNGLLEGVLKFHSGLQQQPPKMWVVWRKKLLEDEFLALL